MPSASTLVLFSGAALTLLLIPGPAVLYIVAHSSRHGRRAGLVSVAGIHAGTAVHITAALLGLSALIVASATAFTVVKLAGATYLIWMGVRTLFDIRASRSSIGHSHDAERSPLDGATPTNLRRVFRDAAVVNILNPKTAVFFLAFVPQFIDPRVGHATFQLVVLSGWFVVLGLLSDGAYALTSAWVGRTAKGRRSGSSSADAGQRGKIAAGLTYIGLGAVTAFSGHTAT